MNNPGGFFLEEIFQFDYKWYGVLRCEYHKSFKRYVSITKFREDSCDWMSLNETLENAVKYFHENDKKSIKFSKKNKK